MIDSPSSLRGAKRRSNPEENKGFTKKYNVDKLGYYEVYTDITDAIQREKQINGGSRKAKLKLIETMNPNWDDLYNELVG